MFFSYIIIYLFFIVQTKKVNDNNLVSAIVKKILTNKLNILDDNYNHGNLGFNNANKSFKDNNRKNENNFHRNEAMDYLLQQKNIVTHNSLYRNEAIDHILKNKAYNNSLYKNIAIDHILKNKAYNNDLLNSDNLNYFNNDNYKTPTNKLLENNAIDYILKNICNNLLEDEDLNLLKNYKTIGENINSVVIASIVFPSIQPVLDLITEWSVDVNLAVEFEINNLLSLVKTLIDDDNTTIIPEIESIINNGNATLNSGIINIFDTLNQSLDINMSIITEKEQTATTSNMNSSVQILNTNIINAIKLAQGETNTILNKYTQGSANSVIQPLVAANNAVYNQVVYMVNNNLNPAIFLPTIVYPDPNSIADIIGERNEAMYLAIKTSWTNALNQCISLINTAVNTAKTNEAKILNSGNNSIQVFVNNNINSSLNNIKALIATVTQSEVAQITALINSSSGNLAEEIQALFPPMIANITDDILNITSDIIDQMHTLIIDNNQNVLDQIINLLSTS